MEKTMREGIKRFTNEELPEKSEGFF